MEEKVINVKIDIEKLYQIALRGVLRAAIFMGFGVNAALREDFFDFRLSQFSCFNFFPEEPSETGLRHFKEEFRLWIESSGLRELTETFAVYLDEVYKACYVMKATKDSNLISTIKRESLRFCAKGLYKKLTMLSEQFSVGPKHPHLLLSMNKARNCLTHRQGIVGSEDLEGGEELVLEWFGMDVFVETPTGDKIIIDKGEIEGIKLDKGGTLKLTTLIRQRKYRLREKVALSTRDLAEICWFYYFEAASVRASVIAFAEREGLVNQRSEH